MLKVCFVLLVVIWAVTTIATAYYFIGIAGFGNTNILFLFASGIILSIWLFLLGLMGEEIRQVDNFQ